MAGDSNDAIPRDVLASVLLRFPASDLRHFPRVCKEWCEVISDPAFIDAHMIHGPRPLTHTIVFFLGRKGGEADEAIEPRSGDGYLFDEHWRLVARFTAGESENMVGTCNGLLCFLDFHQADIRVVEPFTGESLVLPPPETQKRCEPTAYCFGFDPSSRRYKILHQGRDLHKGDATVKDLYVYTIGGGENWRRAHAAAAVPYDGPVFADGSVWSIGTDQHQLAKVVRFDLATEEEIMSEPITTRITLYAYGLNYADGCRRHRWSYVDGLANTVGIASSMPAAAVGIVRPSAYIDLCLR
ncbi:F-box protein DOR-like [Aegilops tauschii subsp. strangulata]|uniref:F-box protein DOR-like n=1 Tax=Aegilops tauschii subsp. strangulata TaxID=200361 RepID=UPI000989C0EC|nr:putative F-box protein At1g53370 [Aegilops tauschii subsp. strangulata]